MESFLHGEFTHMVIFWLFEMKKWRILGWGGVGWAWGREFVSVVRKMERDKGMM